MVFNSLQFLWFFPAVYALYRACTPVFGVERGRRAQNWLLLLASYYFYAAWDYRFLALLAASTIVDYSCGLAMDRLSNQRRRRLVMALSITFNLSLLGFFKYFNFFADNLATLAAALGWHPDFVTLRVLLPIGISFYTFVTMSYVIDVYRREIRPTRNFVDFAVFVALPHLGRRFARRHCCADPAAAADRPRADRSGLWLIAGAFSEDLRRRQPGAARPHVFAHGATRRASTCSSASTRSRSRSTAISPATQHRARHVEADGVSSSRTSLPVSRADSAGVLAALAHQSLHLAAHTCHPAWRQPGSERQTRRNPMITMLLGGLWHGAAWTFVLWGLYQGVLLVLYRPYAAAIDDWRGVRSAVAWIVMFHLTCAGWLIFRAPSVRDLAALARGLFTNFAPSAIDVNGLLVPLVLYVTPLVAIHLVEARADDVLVVPRLPAGVRYFVYSATLYLILLFGNFGGAEFIYFQF